MISSIICNFNYYNHGIDRSDYIKKILYPSSYNKAADREVLIKNIRSLINRHINANGEAITHRERIEDTSIHKLENQTFQKDLDGSSDSIVNDSIPEIFLTENGRTAIYLFLTSLDLKPSSRIAVQPFTCNSSVAPIFWAGHQPVYIDIKEDSLTMDPDLLETEAKKGDLSGVIIQHTFGIPADLKRVVEICRNYNLLLIEDCAHTLDIGTETSNVIDESYRIGLSGDASIISFGLEKVLPTKVGGALLLNNKTHSGKVGKIYDTWKFTSRKRSFLWQVNPFIRSIARKSGRLGTELIEILNKIGLFEVGFKKSELIAEMPKDYPRKLSGNLAWVVNNYFPIIDEILDEKRKQGLKYTESIENMNEGFVKGIYRYPSENGDLQLNIIEKVVSKRVEETKSTALKKSINNRSFKGDYLVPFLKYPIILNKELDRIRVLDLLQTNGFYVTDWYSKVLYPPRTDLTAYNYEPGMCPISERVSNHIINLPTGTIFNPEMLWEISDMTPEV